MTQQGTMTNRGFIDTDCLDILLDLAEHAPVFWTTSGGPEWCTMCGTRFDVERETDGKTPSDHAASCPWKQARQYLRYIGHAYPYEQVNQHYYSGLDNLRSERA